MIKRFIFLLSAIAVFSNVVLSTTASAKDITYPNGAKKAVIFSYDDGVVQDKKLVALFNQYKVKATFNLNSGLFGTTAPWMKDFTGKVGEYILLDEVELLYQGHEIAGHSYTHPGLAGLESKELIRQLTLDKEILSKVSEGKLESFAYPLGSYDDNAIEALAKLGFTNARTVKDTNSFDLPENFLEWHPTVHHYRAMPVIDEYIKLKPEELTVMMIWGHSWEFDENRDKNNWNYAKEMIEKVAGHSDIWYVTAGEFVAFIEQNS